MTSIINTPGSQVSFAVVKRVMYVMAKVMITAGVCPA